MQLVMTSRINVPLYYALYLAISVGKDITQLINVPYYVCLTMSAGKHVQN
jgi:hypothetical protein